MNIRLCSKHFNEYFLIYFEDESGIRWNFRRTTRFSVSVLRFAVQNSHLSSLHGSDSQVPCLDDVT